MQTRRGTGAPLTHHIDVVPEAGSVDALGLHGHGSPEAPGVGGGVVALRLVRGQLPIGATPDHV